MRGCRRCFRCRRNGESRSEQGRDAERPDVRSHAERGNEGQRGKPANVDYYSQSTGSSGSAAYRCRSIDPGAEAMVLLGISISRRKRRD